MDSAQSDVDNVLKVASALREFNTLRQEGIVSEQEFLEMKAKLLAVGKDELGRSPSGDTLETLVEATNEMDSSRASRPFPRPCRRCARAACAPTAPAQAGHRLR